MSEQVEQVVQQDPEFESLIDYTPDELIAPCVNTYDVTKKMYAIRALYRRMEEFAKQKVEAMDFYDQKAKQIEKQVQWLEGNVDNWMAKEGQDRLVTPAGTASYRHREVWRWNEDADKIMEFVKSNYPNLIQVKTDEDFNLTHLKKAIKESGVVPQEIVTVIPETTLEIKLLG